MRFQLRLVALLIAFGIAPEPSQLRILADSIPGAVPAEFAADLLIRIADSPAAAKESAEWRANLYEQAFQLASAAQEPLPRAPRQSAQAESRPGPQTTSGSAACCSNCSWT
jgi:hypothetical protein